MENSLNEKEFRKVVQNLLNEMAIDVLKEEEGKEQIYLGTDKNKLPKGKNQKNVEMSANDSQIGYDKTSKAQVQVYATNSSHNGPFTKGMKKADFDKKNGMPNKNLNGGKESGELHFEIEMDQNDNKIDDNGVKTYVEPGSETKTGQRTPQSSKEAPIVKDKEPIAKAIQLPEGFENKKYTKKELAQFIMLEAKKLI